MEQLEDALRATEILEPMLAEVAQARPTRQGVCRESCGRRG